MGISKLLTEAMSYWPAWLENSWLILSRTSFSGSTVKFTPMPVCFVKYSAVSFCRSTIWGLLTIRTLMLSEPPPAPPPQPAAQPPNASPSPSSGAARRPDLHVVRTMTTPPFAHLSIDVLKCQPRTMRLASQRFVPQWAPWCSDEREVTCREAVPPPPPISP